MTQLLTFSLQKTPHPSRQATSFQHFLTRKAASVLLVATARSAQLFSSCAGRASREFWASTRLRWAPSSWIRENIQIGFHRRPSASQTFTHTGESAMTQLNPNLQCPRTLPNATPGAQLFLGANIEKLLQLYFFQEKEHRKVLSLYRAGTP